MKPILFNTEMVKAILDGRKKVTRRLVKTNIVNQFDVENDNRTVVAVVQQSTGDSFKPTDVAPYKVGDVLYVRETYANISDFVNYADHEIDSNLKYLYKCDDNGKEHAFIDVGVKRWRPSIHMPKEAARIFLRVKDIRVERLQDMDHDAPAKEGIRGYTKDGELYKYAVSDDWWMEHHSLHKKEFKGTFWQDMPKNPTIAFSYLWNSTIPKKDPSDMYKYGWKANPWVWVIEFERISKEDVKCYTS